MDKCMLVKKYLSLSYNGGKSPQKETIKRVKAKFILKETKLLKNYIIY